MKRLVAEEKTVAAVVDSLMDYVDGLQAQLMVAESDLKTCANGNDARNIVKSFMDSVDTFVNALIKQKANA